MAMKTTVYLPDELYDELQAYLKIYPQKNLSSVMREGVKSVIKPKTSRLLELAGFVSSERLASRTREEFAALERERDLEASNPKHKP
jgi:Arc/MetJ-type ribon-helix-helix transcriptional regulator